MAADWPDPPPGLVRLAHVDDLLREREKAWQMLPENSHSSSYEWRSLPGRLGQLGNALVFGSPRAIGLMLDGRLAWIPAGKWWGFNADGSLTGPFHDVVSGAVTSIALQDQQNVKQDVLPFIEAHALAKAMGARRPPAALPPDIVKRVLDVEAGAWLADELALPPPKPPPRANRNKGGRPTVHDWEKFWIEAFVYAEVEAVTGEVKWKTFRTHMHEYAKGMGTAEAPSRSAVDRKLQVLEKAMKARGK